MLQGEQSAILLPFIKLPLPLTPLFCLFLSGRLRQVLLYMILKIEYVHSVFVMSNMVFHIISFYHVNNLSFDLRNSDKFLHTYVQ